MNSEVYSLLILKIVNQISIQSTGHNVVQRPLTAAAFCLLRHDWSIAVNKHIAMMGRQRLGVRSRLSN